MDKPEINIAAKYRLALRAMPPTSEAESEPTAAMVEMPNIRHMRKMRKPPSPSRISRAASCTASRQPSGLCAVSAIIGYAPVTHGDHPVTTLRQIAIMGNQNKGRAARLGEPQYQRHNLFARGLVEITGRFIGKQHLRIGRQSTRQRNALLLAA